MTTPFAQLEPAAKADVSHVSTGAARSARRPPECRATPRDHAVTQIQIDQILIGNAGLPSKVLEILEDIDLAESVFARRTRTDRNDADALIQAVRSGETPTVAVKTREQQQVAAVHRARAARMKTHTARIVWAPWTGAKAYDDCLHQEAV